MRAGGVELHHQRVGEISKLSVGEISKLSVGGISKLSVGEISKLSVGGRLVHAHASKCIHIREGMLANARTHTYVRAYRQLHKYTRVCICACAMGASPWESRIAVTDMRTHTAH